MGIFIEFHEDSAPVLSKPADIISPLLCSKIAKYKHAEHPSLEVSAVLLCHLLKLR